jgi:hypothetical protein
MEFKPVDKEDEYFKLEELARLKIKRERETRETAAEEQRRLKELHWMRCPKCGMALDEIDFRGVKVDACLSCGGMFLDRGEIDKVLEHKEPGFLGRVFATLFRSASGGGS